ncbi:uncharacterized protein PV07_07732 [Cladophialophora immunda]|uniref:tripeptidyl-peptidase II n=1 Tax=Cladophialophora immunda TaxID=569365 RepID=A0A0D2CWR7_9EURO|nr:uncharacterized protein PV07_07732 [Cladophialophora immunda]KIW28044.1 hypothetical protein PV07_07732 [Cladophialophora immunda]
MTVLILTLLLVAWGVFITALPDLSTTVVAKLPAVPVGWTQGKKPSPREVIKLRLAMDHPAMSGIPQHLLDISTPDHPFYGRHLEKHELDDLLRPPSEVTALIIDWLEGEGILAENITYQGTWITLHIYVFQAESLLSTEFSEYHNGDTTLIRTLQYSIPTSLRPFITTVQPTTRFGQPRAQTSFILEPRDSPDPGLISPIGNPGLLTTYNATFCNSTITPECLRGIYRMSDFQADPKGKTKLGVSGFIDEGVYFDDLEDFLKLTGAGSQAHDFSIVPINNGVSDQKGVNKTAEGNLDVQYAVALARGTPVVYYSTAGRAPMLADLDQPTPAQNGSNEPYLDQLHYLLSLNNSDLPDVLTTSYAEDEQTVPFDWAREVCLAFSFLGLRGVSVIFASGDTGVGSACESNDGKNTPRFAPNFPATCPYVTAVGGTYALNPEIAAAFSSGGFSNYFAAPSYQINVTKAYLGKLGNKNKGYFNASGRGYPDVSAQSVRYLIENQDHPQFLYGTSCAAPTFAAIISNLNNKRLAQGKAKLGFLNPWLYSQGYQAFNDITLGRSRGCSGQDMYTGQPAPKITDAGWDAAPGWDPVTGWGTPDFQKLSTMMAS